MILFAGASALLVEGGEPKQTTIAEDQKALLGNWELDPGKNPKGHFMRLEFGEKHLAMLFRFDGIDGKGKYSFGYGGISYALKEKDKKRVIDILSPGGKWELTYKIEKKFLTVSIQSPKVLEGKWVFAPCPDTLAQKAAQKFAKALTTGDVEDALKFAEVPFLTHKKSVIKEMAALDKYIKELVDEIKAGKVNPKALVEINFTEPYPLAFVAVLTKEDWKMFDKLFSKQDWVVSFFPAGGMIVHVYVKVKDGKAKVIGFLR